MNTDKYYYCACAAPLSQKVNEAYRHYFRLYKENAGKAILVEQGLAEKIPSWEKRFNAELNFNNPYPDHD